MAKMLFSTTATLLGRATAGCRRMFYHCDTTGQGHSWVQENVLPLQHYWGGPQLGAGERSTTATLLGRATAGCRRTFYHCDTTGQGHSWVQENVLPLQHYWGGPQLGAGERSTTATLLGRATAGCRRTFYHCDTTGQGHSWVQENVACILTSV